MLLVLLWLLQLTPDGPPEKPAPSAWPTLEAAPYPVFIERVSQIKLNNA